MGTYHCRLCGADALEMLIDFGPQPVAHDLLKSPEQPDRIIHPLTLHQCVKCGFVQINDYIKPEELYKDYNFCFSSWKPQHHMPDEARLMAQYAPGAKVIEIAANDGSFLEEMRKAGFKDLFGVEPNPFAAGQAEENGFMMVKDMFGPSLAKDIKDRHGTFDLLVIRNALEHLPDLHGFFQAALTVLSDKGFLFIEVPDFAKAALETADCSTIWEEHPNYFTETTLKWALAHYGFSVLKTVRYNFSGGMVCVLAQRGEKGGGDAVTIDRADLELGRTFAARVKQYSEILKSKISAARAKAYNVAVYGGGCRASILVNGFGLKSFVDLIIDDQPEKKGCYLAGARLPIKSFEDVDQTAKWIFLLAVNQESEEVVRKKISGRFGAGALVASLFAPNDIFDELEHLTF